MEQMDRGRLGPPVTRIVIAGMATVAVSAIGAVTLLPTSRPVTMDVAAMAAIDESSTTIGFADSDLYGMTPAQIDQQLDEMQAMGVNNVRVMIPWAGVEYYPDTYNWSTVDYMVDAADSRGMGVLGVLNSTPFWATQPGQPALSGAPASAQAYGDFAGLVAQRYAGKVGAYEIWNEPNAYIFYSPAPDPAGYTDLLKAAYPEIKAADPDATVIGGVVGSVITYGNLTMNPIDFVDGIYAAGGEPYFDALSFHPYQYTLPFSTGGWHPDSPINQLAAMHNVMVANGDADKLIWASEYGEPSSVAGEANQAAYLQDMITQWRALDYTGPAFVWTLQDRNTASTDPEDTFGVIRTDGTWKPAAYVIQQLATSTATTPAMARTALAMPDAQQAAPADLAALAAVAEPTNPAAQAALIAPTAAAEPQNPMGAAMAVAQMSLQAGMAVASSVATLNPAVVAMTTLAGASQVAGTTLQEANAVVAGAAPATQTASAFPVAASSPAAIPSPAAIVTASSRSVTEAAPQTAASTAATSAAEAKPAKPATPAADAADTPKESAPAPKSADTPKRNADAPKKRSADSPRRSADEPRKAQADRHR
jgi:polysaccharide biosynthesis protein PslG